MAEDFPPTSLFDLLQNLQRNVNVKEELNVEDLFECNADGLDVHDFIDFKPMPILQQEASTSSATSELPQPQNSIPKRRAFDVEFKLQAVRFAKAHSKNAASRRFGVCRALIQRWVVQENELLGMQTGAKRLKGGGRHRSFPKLDNELADWVRREIGKGNEITRRMIQMRAEQMFLQGGYNDKETTFQASSGWLEKFLERHQIRTAWAPPRLKLPPPPKNFTETLLDLSQNIPKIEAEEPAEAEEFEFDDEMPQLDLDVGLFTDTVEPPPNEDMTQYELNLLNTNPTEFCNYILRKFGGGNEANTTNDLV